MAGSTHGASDADQVAGTRRALRAILRRVPLVLLCAVVGAGAAMLASLLITDRYTAESSLLFRDPGFDQRLFGGDAFQSEDPDRDAATNVELASLDVIADLTAEDIGDDVDGDRISELVEVRSDGLSNVAEIVVTDSDAEFAAQVANAFAENYIEFRKDADRDKVEQARRLLESDLAQLEEEDQAGESGQEIEREIGRLRTLAALQTGNAELVQQADVPDTPSSPRTARNGVIGGFLGFLFGIGFAVLLERLDRRLREPDEFEQSFGVPVLATVSERKGLARSDRDMEQLLKSDSEAFRLLRTRLRYFNVGRDIRSVLVTSAAPGDGKTTVAWNLVASAASAGLSALLIEADFHRPTVASREQLAPLPGLSELLSGQTSLERARQTAGLATDEGDGADKRELHVIVAGSPPPNPGELLESAEMATLLKKVEDNYDLVVIDTPPISVLADAIPLLSMVSGVLVVGRVRMTSRDEADKLKDELDKFGAPVLGVIVNRASARNKYGYYSYGTERASFERSSDKDASS